MGVDPKMFVSENFDFDIQYCMSLYFNFALVVYTQHRNFSKQWLLRVLITNSSNKQLFWTWSCACFSFQSWSCYFNLRARAVCFSSLLTRTFAKVVTVATAQCGCLCVYVFSDINGYSHDHVGPWYGTGHSLIKENIRWWVVSCVFSILWSHVLCWYDSFVPLLARGRQRYCLCGQLCVWF